MTYIVNLDGFPPDLQWFYNFYASINDEKKFMGDVLNYYLQLEPMTAVFISRSTHEKVGGFLQFANEDEFLAFRLRWS